MRKLMQAVVLLLVASFVWSGIGRKFGRPHVVARDSNIVGTNGTLSMTISKQEWPAVWKPSLVYSVTLAGDPEELMLMKETVSMMIDGRERVILTCIGIMKLPDPPSVCRAPEPMGVQPPELIRSIRVHMDVYRVIRDDLAQQIKDARQELDRIRPLVPQTQPSPAIIY